MAQRAIARARAGVTPTDSAAVLDGSRAATVLLAAGRREPARSLIRMLARSMAAGALPPVLGPSLVTLAREFTAWTGDVEFLEKYLVAWAGGGRESEGEQGGDGHEAVGDDALAVLDEVVRGVWGLEPRADWDQLSITLRPSPSTAELALTGIRIGRTTLALRYRCRPGQVALRCEVTRGPRLRVTAALGGPPGTVQVSVDEVALGGGRAVFQASGEHEVVFRDEVAGGS